MNNDKATHFTARIKFERTGYGEFPYRASVGNQNWIIRVNDFPEEPLYTLIVDGEEAIDFDDWPPNWEKPRE